MPRYLKAVVNRHGALHHICTCFYAESKPGLLFMPGAVLYIYFQFPTPCAHFKPLEALEV